MNHSLALGFFLLLFFSSQAKSFHRGLNEEKPKGVISKIKKEIKSNSKETELKALSLKPGTLSSPVFANPTIYNVTGTGTWCSASTGAVICLSGSQSGVTYQLVQQGLWATYYPNKSETPPSSFTQLEPNINYANSGAGFGPYAGNGQAFSTVWTGYIIAPSTGTYNFQTISDDGIRVTLSGSYIINNWTDHGSTTDNSGNVSLVAGQSYPITVEFYQQGGNTQAQFLWQLNGGGYSIIPTSAFYTSTQIGTITNGGNGSAFCFPPQTIPGPYTVIATNNSGGLQNPMNGVINVSSIPSPSLYTLSGGGTQCGGTETLTLSGSQSGVNYQLYNGASAVGSAVAGTGSSLSFTASSSGTYTVVATAGNGCTLTMTGSPVVTINTIPTVYNLTGPTTVCSGSTATFTLSGSQSGVNYQLKVGGVNSGSAVAGTGSSISFTATAAGTYTVVATNSVGGCTANMNNSVVLSLNALPNVYNVTGGGSYCSNGYVDVYLSNSDVGYSYQLQKNGSAFGNPISGQGIPIDFQAYSPGTYTILATNSSTGCTVLMSGSVSVSSTALPTAYTVGGGGAYCSGSAGPAITLSGSQSNVNYQFVQQGLTAQYWNNTNLQGAPVATRIESQINYPLQSGFGPAGINATNYSTKWTGFLIAPVSGSYTFNTSSDDGVRLWVNGSLILDDWNIHGTTSDNSTSINLTAGQIYPIILEYFQSPGGTVAILSWTYPGQALTVIPAANFLTANTSGTTVAGTGSGISFPSITTAGTYQIIATNSNGCIYRLKIMPYYG